MKRITFLTVITIILSLSLNAQTALDFEEPGQSVQISGITCPSEFTFEALINRQGTGGFRTILEFGNDAPYIGIFNNKLILFNGVTSNNTIPLNEWIHIAITYSLTNLEAKLYINGVLDNTATNVTLNITGTGAGIGQNQNDTVFGGSIDDVKLWDVVRTEAEVLADIDTCFNGTETGLYALYNFNEATGTIANDLTGNFNGTLINMDPATDWVAHNNCNTNTTLSVEAYSNISQIKLFPNPSSSFLQVSGLTKTTPYRIYNFLGTEISNGMISATKKINIQHLNNGIYFIKIKNRNAKKFLKK